MPAFTASSTMYWMAGLSTMGSISLGIALVAGSTRVPSPAAGMIALRTFCAISVSNPFSCCVPVERFFEMQGRGFYTKVPA